MDLSLSEAKHKGLTKLLVETENTFLFPWCCALPLLRAGERQSVSSSDCWVLMKVRQVARVVFISLIFFDDCTDDGSLVATTILSELHLFLSLSFQELLDRWSRMDSTELGIVTEHLASNLRGDSILS